MTAGTILSLSLTALVVAAVLGFLVRYRRKIAALGFATIAQAGNIVLALYTFSRNGLPG